MQYLPIWKLINKRKFPKYTYSEYYWIIKLDMSAEVTWYLMER